MAVGAALLPVLAQETNVSDRIVGKLESSPAGIWSNDMVGDGFCRGLHEFGFVVGAGVAAPHIGDRSAHNLALAKFHYGWMLGGVTAKDKWYRGNWEVLEELFAGGQSYPKSSYVAGEATMLRYNFATGTRWVPFFDAGIGVLATDIGNPDLGTVFEFNGQIGPGINFFWRKNSAVSLQYRFTHYSNAGIKEPNQGVNEHMFYVGVAWYF